MSLNFASQLTKMIDAGLGAETEAPESYVAVGYNTAFIDAESAAIVSFHTNTESAFRSLIVALVPIQAGTGDPSPENVRPITGHTAVTVWRSGVNVWNEEWELGTLTQGEPQPSNINIRAKNYIKVAPNTRYYVRIPSGFRMYLGEYDADKNFLGYVDGFSSSRLVDTKATTHYLRFVMASTYGTTYNHDISINYPSTDTDYHQGNVHSVTVQLGQTVYGGTLDVVTGALIMEWANIASYDGETLPGEWISDRDVYSPGTTPTTGAQVCYKLETPITVQLDPETVTTLIGQNNVLSDSGNVALTYPEIHYTEGY